MKDSEFEELQKMIEKFRKENSVFLQDLRASLRQATKEDPILEKQNINDIYDTSLLHTEDTIIDRGVFFEDVVAEHTDWYFRPAQNGFHSSSTDPWISRSDYDAE